MNLKLLTLLPAVIMTLGFAPTSNAHGGYQSGRAFAPRYSGGGYQRPAYSYGGGYQRPTHSYGGDYQRPAPVNNTRDYRPATGGYKTPRSVNTGGWRSSQVDRLSSNQRQNAPAPGLNPGGTMPAPAATPVAAPVAPAKVKSEPIGRTLRHAAEDAVKSVGTSAITGGVSSIAKVIGGFFGL